MSVGLLLITHNDLGTALLTTATRIFITCPMPVATLGVSEICEPENLLHQLKSILNNLDQGDGVLILTDMYGSTPANIATRLQQKNRTNVVAGINLPMLVRILNHAHLNLADLTERAISGGRDGVVECVLF
jgi:PTS system ascorbate-specific IIA component